MQRPIKSYVKREGRMTEAQSEAIRQLYPAYTIDHFDSNQPLSALFGDHKSRYFLEIGFGNGELLYTLASRHPDDGYIGIEVHRPGLGHLLYKLEKNGVTNIRISNIDAMDSLKNNLPDHSLDGIYLFFPDPWQKKKHRKRRIINHEFIELIQLKLKNSGIFHMATDWQDYARYTLELFEASSFINMASASKFCLRPEWRPLTKYEQKGLNKGHQVFDLIFQNRVIQSI